MPLSPRRADPAAPFIYRTTYHDVVMGDYKGRIYVRRWLPRTETGPVLIAVHKLTGSSADFAFLAERLAAAGWQVICPDLPGHGRSTQFKDSEAYATGNLSRALDTVFSIYARDAEPVSLLGASWGGASLLFFLAAFQRKIRALIVNDIAFEYDPYLDRYNTYLRSEWPRRYASLRDARQQLVARNHVLFRQRDNHRIDSEILRRYLDSHIGQTAAGKYRFNYDVTIMKPGRIVPETYPDYIEIVKLIQAERIMLMFGEHSLFRKTETVQRLRREDPRVEYVEISDAGHTPRLLTEREVGIVREFLERPSAGRRTSTF